MNLNNELRMANTDLILKTDIFFKSLRRFKIFKKIIDNKISGSKKTKLNKEYNIFFNSRIMKEKKNARMLMSKIGYQPFLTIQFYMAGVLIPKHTRDIHYVNFASREPGK